MTTYSVESTPAGHGFAYLGSSHPALSWLAAINAAAAAADNCDHPTVFWAVEREVIPGTSARPVIWKIPFPAKSPFGTRYPVFRDAEQEARTMDAQVSAIFCAAAAMGRKGGQARVKKGAAMLTPEQQAERARKGWITRRAVKAAAAEALDAFAAIDGGAITIMAGADKDAAVTDAAARHAVDPAAVMAAIKKQRMGGH